MTMPLPQPDAMKSYPCWLCHAEVGKTDGAVLYLSNRVHVRRPLTIWCVCGGATFWRPVRSKVAVCEQAQSIARS